MKRWIVVEDRTYTRVEEADPNYMGCGVCPVDGHRSEAAAYECRARWAESVAREWHKTAKLFREEARSVRARFKQARTS